MHFRNLTFNDLPTVVGELCKRIESLETVLKNSLAVQNKVKENHHVPMTVDEVCTYLGISKSSFYYKVKHGGIPVIKQGKHLFVYRDELDKWLETGRKKRSTAGLILDVILTLCTGGLWLIWILIRYLRNNS